MSLLETLRQDMISATKAGDVHKVGILKIALSSIKNEQIASESELKDADIEKILRKEVRKIEDSIFQYEKMGREDLVSSEKADFEVINSYLPKLMSDEKIKEVVVATISEIGATDKTQMGRVMGMVMKELNGKADGNTVKNIVEQLLS